MGAWFLDDVPSSRFPVYCRGNVGEIVPKMVTPLSSTVTTEAFRLAFTQMFADTGAFHAAEMVEPSITGGLFGGYLYFNLSFARSFAARAPGVRVADVDRQMFGGGEAPPFRRGPGDRSLRTKLRAARGAMRMLRRGGPDLDASRAETQAWIASIPLAPSDDELVALVAGFAPRLAVQLRELVEAGFGAAIPTSLIERVAKGAERREPGLLVKAMSGLGGIETARPAVELWRLGRTVAQYPSLTAAFDAGIDGLQDRLRAAAGADRAVAGFLERFDAFLIEHGHRGPNEVELASDTWGSDPASVLAVVERLRLSPESADPEVAAPRLAKERSEARGRLRRAVAPPLRPLITRLLETAARGTARREQAKGTIVLGVSALRRPLFLAADRLVRAGQLPDRKQFFMATVEELPKLLDDPATLGAELAARRATYEDLNDRVPPFAFEAELPDPATWPRRADRPRVTRTGPLTGIGVSAGVGRGRARVITDPRDPRGIEPGEVLVAPLTDPAWTPLFLAATAVVVDVGALQSHAAIVARELGIPAVVSVEGASRRLIDGDFLEVDGDRGTVTVLGPTADG
ncbi:MAG: rifampicin phosphotransferase [Acidimicrobiia bacterium]|nr:rifampicin phosphotransferase [Acidimicrobiia bacterium]